MPSVRSQIAAAIILAATTSAFAPSRRAARRPSPPRAARSEPAFPPASTYTWRGHKCSFRKAGAGPPVVLLHGFAGSAFNCWRSTLPALAGTHTVYGLDLLGLGASDPPSDDEYGNDLCRAAGVDSIAEQVEGGGPAPVLIATAPAHRRARSRELARAARAQSRR